MSFLDKLLSDNEIGAGSRKFLALLLLVCASAIAVFGRFEGTVFYMFSKTYSISPDFLAGVLAIALITPLYLRGILTFRFSVYGLISAFLLLFVFSSLIQVVKGDGWLTTIKTLLIIAAIALSWLGMRGVANVAWFLLFVGVVINVQNLSDAMGIWGWLFVALSFFGLILHTRLGPAALVQGLRAEFIEGRVIHDALEQNQTARTDYDNSEVHENADISNTKMPRP